MKGVPVKVLLLIMLVGAVSAPYTALGLEGTLQEINSSGTIRIGYRQSLPPLSFADKQNRPGGYSIDLCSAIVAEAEAQLAKKIRVEYVPVNSEDRFDALTSGKIDILCGATTDTLARRERVDFTQLTFVTGGSFLAMRGHRIKNNFEGKRIGVGKDTTTEAAVRKLFDEIGTTVELVRLKSLDEGMKFLVRGEIDVLSADQAVLIGLVMKEPAPGDFALLPDMFSFEPLALAVRRNDADFRLVANRAITRLCRTREIETIYEKWFGQFAATMPSAFQALIELNSIPEQ